ncbi:nucleoid-associated protein [Luteibacter anthropi]|uniref:nucleoid-associated protein n=1 Tax=Luteibacter anthropi TaxID=564369 RepID=UPI0020328692|nr:nucleoid-associated protein [Luteibacter anthropi]URX63725.1 nucleoid-associated protein [Luteibacter anthropi]
MDRLDFAVIHELAKDRGSDTADAKLRNQLLDVTKPMVIRLANLLAGLMGHEQGALYYGQFGDRRREGPFPGAVAEFVQDTDSGHFMALTHSAMRELVTYSAKEPLATGGFIFFAAYSHQNSNYLLVAMIKERDGIHLTEDFEPEEINEVDLSKLHQAARINLVRYAHELAQLNGPADVIDEQDDSDADAERERTYLCFVNRSGRDDIAGYFTTALGCEKGVSSARATKGVVKAVRAYVKSVKAIADHASKARQSIIDYMASLDDGTTVTLDHVVEVVGRQLPVELVQHLDGMKAFLNSDAYQIPDDFQVSKKALKTYARISERTDRWSLNFEASALSVNDGEVIYSREQRSLTIRQLPERMIKKIEQTLRDRDQLAEDN